MQMYGDLYVAAQKGYLSALHFRAYTLQVVNICDLSLEKGAYENFTIRLISPSQP